MHLHVYFLDKLNIVSNAFLQVVAQTIKSCLDRLPGSSRTQIGFITFDSTIHFYNIKASGFDCY